VSEAVERAPQDEKRPPLADGLQGEREGAFGEHRFLMSGPHHEARVTFFSNLSYKSQIKLRIATDTYIGFLLLLYGRKKMFRTVLFALAFMSGPALAASHYHAEPLAQPTKQRVVTRDGVWSCSGGSCVAPRGNSRAEIACAVLVREVGALKSFSADGIGFGVGQLAKCNARAR
jgi:hypothetical protein